MKAGQTKPETPASLLSVPAEGGEETTMASEREQTGAKRGVSGSHRWGPADTLTTLRMALSLILLLIPWGTWWFTALYTLAGLTDALDGWVARRTGSADEFGARLDSVADLLFYGVLLFRIFPVLRVRLPGAIWPAVTAVLAVRLAAYLTAWIRYHRFASLHTWLNKATGGALFLFPYVLPFPAAVGYGWALCALAMAASAEELAIHLLRRTYEPGRKSIFGR